MQRDVSAKVCGLIKTKRLYESVDVEKKKKETSVRLVSSESLADWTVSSTIRSSSPLRHFHPRRQSHGISRMR